MAAPRSAGFLTEILIGDDGDPFGGVGCQGPADPMDDKILRARRRKAAGCVDFQMRAHIEIRSRETAVCLRERERKLKLTKRTGDTEVLKQKNRSLKKSRYL
jgi:hypothetical protein